MRLAELKTFRPVTGEVYLHTGYTVSLGGNVENIADLQRNLGAVDRAQSFAYDAMDQLIHAEGFDQAGNYTHDYAYDKAGNIIRNQLLSPDPLFYDGGGLTNRLLGHSDGVTTTVLFGYDANGNTRSMPGRQLSFDPHQQLERVQVSNGTDVRLFYNYRGVLARKEVSRGQNTRIKLIFDKFYEIEDNKAMRWIFLGELPVARESGGVSAFLHNHHLRRALLYTDKAGNLSAPTAYSPFRPV